MSVRSNATLKHKGII